MLTSTYFTPTLPSRASRHIPLRSRGHFTGALVTYFNREFRAVVFESRLELRVAYLWSTRPDVVDLIDQYPAIHYLDANGQVRYHILDYVAVMRNGRKIGLAVKPSDSARRHDLVRTLKRVMAHANGAVDEIRLVTEKSFSLEAADNAELMHFMGSEVDDEADAIVGSLIQKLTGTTTIESVVNASGLEGRAFRSIVRLIARRVCRQVTPGHLRYPTQIAKAV